ncbi:hypothetical protein JCM11641_004574 [Rhodosporidiobolus odoratus]
MCSSHATIFYGVFVRTIALCAAAHAWEALEPAMKAIHLICLRRKSGTLEGDQDSRTRAKPDLFDQDATSAIAFPDASSTLRLPNVMTESSAADGISAHEVALFSPNVFDRTGAAAARIRLFAHLFRLEVVDPCPPSTTPSTGASGSKMNRKVKLAGKPVFEPRWQMWASSRCCP